jgi:CRP-like cAMP-binding protein
MSKVRNVKARTLTTDSAGRVIEIVGIATGLITLSPSFDPPEKVLKSFPSAVRRKILRKLYLRPLVQTQLMRGVRQQFVDAFLASCTVEIFSPGEEIVERGAILSDLFLLVGGIAEITTHGFGGNRSVVEGEFVDSEDETRPRPTKLGPGDFIGEIAFFTESPQVDSVVTVTTCKTLTISQSTYKILVQDHPGSVGKILQNLLEKVEGMSLRLPLPEEIPVLRVGSVFHPTATPSDLDTLADSCTYDYGAFDTISNEDEEYFVKKEALTAVTDLVKMHMSKQLDDQTTRLLFAASRGDTSTISLMCDQGFDPNNSDYDNRTALMVASMKGNTDIVRLLLVDYKVSSDMANVVQSKAHLLAYCTPPPYHTFTLLLFFCYHFIPRRILTWRICMGQQHSWRLSRTDTRRRWRY